MLAYAAADTAPLPALREQLRARLTALGRLAWAEEEFTHLEALRWTGAPDGGGPEAFLRVKGAKALAPRQLAALRELHRWREAVGAELDRATFRIIGNDALLAVAKALPRAPAELGGIAALPPSLAARHGPALLEGVRRALALRSEEHTSELQSLAYLVCRLLLEKKKTNSTRNALTYTCNDQMMSRG